jgi:hypothetical protein
VTLIEQRAPERAADSDADADALIKEARRLRRRRWFFRSTLAAIAAGAGAAGYFVASSSPPAPHHPAAIGSRSPGSSAPAAHAFVPTRSPDLIQPTTLATLPSGNLLILDSSRDQILELKPDGDLSVFAGNGRLGFTGDGGPARDAELDLTYFSSAAMVFVGPSGSVDVFDDGNCRIRAISPNGVIRTIVRIPRIKVYPQGNTCPVAAFAVSPAGRIYLAQNSEIERVSSGGRLVWVAGAHGSRTYLTPSHVAFFPDSLAFNDAGDLYIWNSSPKVMFRLTPTGKLTQLLGVSYATQLTTAPNGTVLAGAHGGWIQEVTPSRVRAFYDVIPTRVAGLNWGREEGFQEDGIAVSKTGTTYVDSAEGNGYALATVLVQISRTRHASLVPIRTPLAATLPRLDAPGFPASLYPATHGSHGPALGSCPSDQGLEPFTPVIAGQARRIAKTYLSTQFASDIAVTDRSWWTSDFNQYADGDIGGNHAVTGERPASNSPAGADLTQACGSKLVDDSIAVAVGSSEGSDFTGTLYFLDRDGHALVYDARGTLHQW